MMYTNITYLLLLFKINYIIIETKIIKYLLPDNSNLYELN